MPTSEPSESGFFQKSDTRLFFGIALFGGFSLNRAYSPAGCWVSGFGGFLPEVFAGRVSSFLRLRSSLGKARIETVKDRSEIDRIRRFLIELMVHPKWDCEMLDILLFIRFFF